MNEDFYIQLIYKKLTGEISEAESHELEDWLKASADHKTMAQQIELAWKASADLKPAPAVDLDAAFERLEKQIEADEETPVRSMRWRSWAVAATIILLIGIGFLLRSFWPTKEKIEWVELRTGDQIDSIRLSDQSMVKLNKNSYLKYPRVFAQNSRSLQLEGEAFFEVEKDISRPFVIETTTEEVRVLGTSFNVRAYENENVSVVSVASGKVELKSKQTSSRVLLERGDKGSLDRNTNSLQKIPQAVQNEMAWMTGRLVFENTALKEVFKEIEKLYEVNIELVNADLAQCMFTYSQDNEDISIVLDAISTVFELEIQFDGANTYQLIGGSCE